MSQNLDNVKPENKKKKSNTIRLITTYTHVTLQKMEYQLTLNIKNGYEEGVLLGQIAEFPSVTIQANNEEELLKEANIALKGYFKAFPEEKAKIERVVSQKTISVTV